MHKRRPQSGKFKEVYCTDIFRTGVFRSGYPHFLVQKTSDFSKFMMCLHGLLGAGELKSVQTFCGQGKGR